MSATSQIQNLHLAFQIPAELEAIIKDLEDINDFMAYYDIVPEFYQDKAIEVLKDRIELYSRHEAGGLQEDIPALLSGENLPETDTAQRLLNIYHLIHFQDQNIAEPISLAALRNMHKQLALRMPHEPGGGELRFQEVGLFGANSLDPNLPNGDELRNLLTDLLKLAIDPKIHSLQRAFLFYFIFINIQPFHQDNEIIAMLASRQILLNDGFDLYGMINLEKHLYYNKRFHLQTAELLHSLNYHQRINTAPTAWLVYCMEAFRHNVQELRHASIGLVKEQLNYQSLSPRQKNVMNFWLEKAFPIHKNKLNNLSLRQQEIVQILVRSGNVANKELATLFSVDRKTIQRDFNELVQLGIADQRGLGRNLKYYLDFRIYLS